jgi:hypothetical protein
VENDQWGLFSMHFPNRNGMQVGMLPVAEDSWFSESIREENFWEVLSGFSSETIVENGQQSRALPGQ